MFAVISILVPWISKHNTSWHWTDFESLFPAGLRGECTCFRGLTGAETRIVGAGWLVEKATLCSCLPQPHQALYITAAAVAPTTSWNLGSRSISAAGKAVFGQQSSRRTRPAWGLEKRLRGVVIDNELQRLSAWLMVGCESSSGA